MALFEPMELIKRARGKICGHSDYYFAEKNGTQYTGKICYPSTKAPTAKQTALRERFAQARTNIKALTTEEKAAYLAAYKAYDRGYKTLNGYIFAQEMAKLKPADDGE